jgi:predicted permease
VQIVGRLSADTSVAGVQSELDALLRSYVEEHPARKAPDSVLLKQFSHQFVNEITRGIMLTMFAAVVLVLVMACTNVANLFVARSVARLRETAICSAIGASRARLLTRLVAEAGLLSLLAAAIGFGLAQWAGWATVRAMHSREDAPPNWTAELVIDGWSFLAAAALALLATLAASAIPALRLMRSDLNQTLRSGGAGSIGGSAMGRKLVVFQVALCTVLLVCSGLTTISVVRQQALESGVRTDGVLTGRAGLFQGSYPDDAALTRFAERLQTELRAIPGVTHATLSSSLPMTNRSRNFVEPEGLSFDAQIGPPLVDAAAVDNQFFDTFSIARQSGRGFSSADQVNSQPVAIVSRSFAAEYWPGRDPIGQRLRLGRDETVGEWRSVIGVVEDVQHDAQNPAAKPLVVYTSLAQTPARFLSFALIGPADTDSLHDAVRAAVQRVDPDLPVYWLRSLDQWIGESRFENELLAMLFGAFGLFALFLTAAGIYAVLAHSISQRQREIGVRRALGADNRGLLRMLIGQNGRLLGIGLALGLVGALLFSPLLQRVLFEVDARDPQAVGVALAALLVTVAIAAVVPVRRALRVEPMAALRQD